MSLAAGVLADKLGVPAPRRGAALLGVFAILLQAALFGWHNHPLPLSARGTSAVSGAASGTGPQIPGRADNDCQICFALGHHGATPVGFVAASPPADAVLRPTAFGEFVTPGAPYVLFRSRAPPRA